jgi:CHASE3 domain sensor protein
MLLKPLSPAARLLVSFAMTAPSLLVTVACVFTFQDLRRMNAAFDWVRHALKAQNLIHQLVLDVYEFESGQRDYLFSGRGSRREAFAAAKARVPGDLAALGQGTAPDAAQRNRFFELQALVLQRLDLAGQTVDLKRAGKHDDAHKLARSELGRAGLDRIHALADEMRKHEELLLDGRDSAVAARRRSYAQWLYGLLVLNVGTLACTLFLLHRLDKAQSLARVCAWSKRIEHEGQWISFEEYLSCRFRIHSTHTISPAALDRAMTDLASEPSEEDAEPNGVDRRPAAEVGAGRPN